MNYLPCLKGTKRPRGCGRPLIYFWESRKPHEYKCPSQYTWSAKIGKGPECLSWYNRSTARSRKGRFKSEVYTAWLWANRTPLFVFRARQERGEIFDPKNLKKSASNPLTTKSQILEATHKGYRLHKYIKKIHSWAPDKKHNTQHGDSSWGGWMSAFMEKKDFYTVMPNSWLVIYSCKS